MQMRHQPRFFRKSAHQVGVDFDRIERGKPQPRQFRHMAQDRAHQRAQPRPARQIEAIGGQIHAGQHDLAIAVFGEAAGLRHHFADRNRARRPAAIRNDAEGAAVIAAVLHLHEGPRVPFKAVDQMERGIVHRREIVDDDFFLGGDAEIEGAFQIDPGRGRVFRKISEYAINLGHRGERSGLGLGGAAGNDDLGVRVLPLQAADGLARLADGLGGHGARIDDDRIRESCRFRIAAHQLRLRGVQPATEGDDFDHRVPHAAASMVWLSLPSNSVSTGPVMST